MFEFLLKYSPVVFSEGKIAYKFLPSIFALLGTIVVFLIVLWLIYRETTLRINRFFKGSLLGLKFIAIAILLAVLLEPVINVSTIIPRKSSLILLVDDSKSMTIKDAQGQITREQFVTNLLGKNTKPGLLEKLRKNFKIQLYKFSSEVESLKDAENISAQGVSTQLAKSLNFAHEYGAHGATAAVVLFTDGADNGEEDPLEAAALLQNSNLPIYVVGVGSVNFQDIELSKVVANQSVIENSVVEVSALIKNKSFENQTVELELKEGSLPVKKQTVQLQGTGTRTSIKFSPQNKGFVHYTLNLIPQENEFIKENNIKSFLIDNRNKRARILYIEGYPRTEFKYLRRALDGDESIELISLLRTGPDKFYRQGIKNQNELKDGYPKTKKELFEYEAIIFGSIESEFFSEKELENTLDFVSQRGGGFLMLGGGYSFAQGGYQVTPIEKLLPVVLPFQNGLATQIPASFREKFKLALTPEGLHHPILQLSSVESENKSMWEKLPELVGYNPLGRAKPGATVLALHPLSKLENPKIILALQRYGKGRTMIFANSSSWHWQMGMHHDDRSHERFWRQMLRWLALSSPKPVELNLDKEIYIPNEQVTLKVDIRDSTFTPIEDATIKAHITTPSGNLVEIPFNWSSNGKVEYMGAYHPDKEGLYLVEIMTYSSKGDFLGKTESAFFVEESKVEFANAHLQNTLLKRIAELSGGVYYHEKEAERLPDEISVIQSSYSKMVEYDLWDMPLLFLLVILILSIEWYVRRSKGLS
ncbi:MAG: glutamine amidotransferase [bacterium]